MLSNYLPEEQVTNEYRSDDTCRIGNQTARYGMAGLGDTYTTEIHGQDVECGIGRALEDACQTAYERVGAVGGHGIDHQASGTASAKRFHDGCRKASHKVAVDAAKFHTAFDGTYQVIHGS